MDIAYIHGKVHAIGGYLPMRWVEYDHEEVPISMDKYFIHGCGRSMGTMQHLRELSGRSRKVNIFYNFLLFLPVVECL